MLPESAVQSERDRQIDPGVKLTTSALNSHRFLGQYADPPQPLFPPKEAMPIDAAVWGNAQGAERKPAVGNAGETIENVEYPA